MTKLPDFEAMAIFAKIVETRSISAAAAELALSAPTVSKALMRLEQRLGCRLVNRSSHRLVLTEAGRALVDPATKLLMDGEAVESALVSQSVSVRGVVRLAAPMSFGLRAVAPIIPAFMSLYPHVSVELSLNDVVVDMIGEGFDIALRIGELPDSTLLVRRLGDVPSLVVAAPAYLDRRGRPSHPSELTHHDCFTYAYARNRDIWQFYGATGERVTVRPTSRLQANNGEALLPALLAGLGISPLPEFILGDLVTSGALEKVLPAWRASRAGLHLLTPPDGPRPARIQALINFLVEQLSPC